VDQDLLKDFGRFVADPAADEVRMAILVARMLDETVRADAVNTQLAELAARRPPGQSPWDFLRSQDFRGDAQTYASLHNSNLAWVIEHRRGIPITLGIVLLHVARLSGHGAVGLNFPGHFLVQVDAVTVDPFVMQPVVRQDLVSQLPAEARALSEAQLFAPASAVAVGLRMLNNIKLAHLTAAAWHRALDIVDAQLRLAPHQSLLHLERGDLWRRVGLAQAARAAYQQALALASAADAEDVRKAAEARLGDLGDARDIIH
jgi:regulator of sirC expression with transglutaminase-like and TPR domain